MCWIERPGGVESTAAEDIQIGVIVTAESGVDHRFGGVVSRPVAAQRMVTVETITGLFNPFNAIQPTDLFHDVS